MSAERNGRAEMGTTGDDMGRPVGLQLLHRGNGSKGSRNEDTDVYSEEGEEVIEIKLSEAEKKRLRELRKYYPEEFAEPMEFREIKRMPTCPNMPTSRRRRTNVLRRYISRLYRLCLVNTVAAIVLAAVYTETRNEAVYAAMFVCIGNALLAWACSD